MPYKVVKGHGDCPTSKPFAVVKKDGGKMLGCHATRKEADDQIAAINISESKRQAEQPECSEGGVAVDETQNIIERIIGVIKRELYRLVSRPYPNEHSARLEDPDQYIRFRRENDKFGKGIDAIWGVKEVDGEEKVELQAIRFDKTKFTVAEAKAWLKDHDYSGFKFEKASEEEERERAIAFRYVYDQVWGAVNDLPDGTWTWVQDIYLDGPNTYAIVTRRGKLYRVPLTINEHTVTLGEWEEVMEIHEPVTSRTIVRQQDDGRFRWFSISATAVLNRVAEIDSRDLFDSFIAHAEETGEYPVRDFYHLCEQFRTGQADFLARDGDVYITSGLYDDTELARREVAARQADPEAWGDSIMYLPLGEPEMVEVAEGIRVPVYRSGINTFISTLPEAQAASLFTVSRVQEVTRMLKGKVLTAFVDLFGGDEEEARSWLETNVDETNRAIVAGALITRDKGSEGEGSAGPPEGEAPPAGEPPEPVAVEMTEEDMAEIVRLVGESETVADVVRNVTEATAALTEMQGTLEELVAIAAEQAGRLAALEQSDEAKLRQQVQDMGRRHQRAVRIVRPRRARAEDEEGEEGEPGQPEPANVAANRIMEEKKIVGG